jgi:DNA repair protein SbcC/Rad50
MRPVMLEMNGFASFREPTQVDFSDADFFALIGPTGSGKSTVIDAMTFALYGSVPRWDRKGKVSLALAPTIARGTVKLVFEVEGQRYVVARELRRGSGQAGQVSQRAASLERLSDPDGLAQPGEPTEVLARDLSGVTDAVERLLGLSYEDFCQCVVLPQGQFANFLHARTGDRQEILLRLLGAEHYRKMMERANQQASVAAQRADTLTETLTTLADATPEAEDTVKAAEKALASLSEQVEAARPRIQAADAELAAAEAELGRLEEERAALAAVHVPEDISALDSDLGTSRSALQAAQAAEKLAEETDRASRAALADGPQRAPLELARERRAERDEHVARLPALQDDAAKLSALSGQAETQVNEASSVLEERRAGRDEATRRAEAAAQRVDGLSADHAALVAVSVPDGTDRLDERRRAAADAAGEASAALQDAEQADSEARSARNGAVPEAPLEQALRDLRALENFNASLPPLRASLQRAREQRAVADAALESAETVREERQQDVDEARRAHAAADLRPHLIAGRPCPVCEQTVSTLPVPLHAPAIHDAQARLDAAITATTSARNTARTAASAEARSAAELDTLADQRTRWMTSLTTAVAGPLASASLPATADLLRQEPEPASQAPATPEAAAALDKAQARRGTAAIAEVTTSLKARRSLDETANAAGTAVDTARARLRAAQTAQEKAETEITSARYALRAARDPLVQLGAPSVDDTTLAAAWMRLTTWAAGQAQTRALELAEARQTAQATASQRDNARAAFTRAETDLAKLRTDATATARAEQQARTQFAELAARISELDRLLQTAPDEDELTAQLALRDKLEAAAAAADQQLLSTRTDRTDAARALTSLEQAESSAFARLSAARDPVVTLGAPTLEGVGILAAWTTLATWAASQVTSRDQNIDTAQERETTARAKAEQLTSGLGAALAAGGIELAPDAVASGASSAVAGALERARAATARIAERRLQATDLTARRDAAHDEQQVARLLGDLLRSDRFPRWLVSAAVDVLVADASVNLAGLSGGQFDLTYEDGEFYVIDHADADSRRSVRTLSGGETFQASLALALALSSQMSALAAAGAARLDSIFLDEGFGTLDPETLDVVATTLETLAQGKRMVGVITHVAALAERVPVRFIVSRDARTSSVTREGFTPVAGAA